MLTNQPSLPPPGMQPGGAPGAPQGPGPGATSMSAAGGPGKVMGPSVSPGAGAVQEKAAQIKPAQAPRNPMNGQRGPLPGAV